VTAGARQRGRPTKPAKKGEKTTLSLRVTPSLKERLDSAGDLSGRNLSQEAEIRLERSFHEQDLLISALDLAFGTETTALLLIFGEAIRSATTTARFSTTFALEVATEWTSDPYAYGEAAKAIAAVLDALRPEGEPIPPKFGSIPGVLDLNEVYKNQLGPGFARSVLEAVCGDPATRKLATLSDQIRERLQDETVDRVRTRCRQKSKSETGRGTTQAAP
jgi:hypothetical protein